MDDLDVEALLEASLKKKDSAGSETSQKQDEHDKQNQDEKNVTHNGTSRDMESEKRNERKRGRSRSRSPRRQRSRSHSGHRRPRHDRDRRERDRDRDRDRDYRHRDYSNRDRERDHDRDRKEREKRHRDEERARQRAKEALLDPKEREAIETDRDQRTVFALNLPLRADEDDLIRFFGKAGKVRDIRMITDRNSRRSKGCGYVEYYDKGSIPAALKLSGTPCMGQVIQVQPTYAEKNRLAAASNPPPPAPKQQQTTHFAPTRLYVSSLHFDVTEDDLRSVFDPYGDLEFINIITDSETGRCKGFAFIQFRRSSDAKRAMHEVDGMEIIGKRIKVGPVTDSNKDAHFHDLDDDEGGGLSLNAQSRTLLMQKLQRNSSMVDPMAAPVAPPSPPRAPSQISTISGTTSFYADVPTTDSPTPCVILKNMFDPESETEPNWVTEIQEDTKEECGKFGPVDHIFVDKNSAGHVFMKFGSVEAAQNAVKALHHRYFAGKMITAEFVSEATYFSLFPEASHK